MVVDVTLQALHLGLVLFDSLVQYFVVGGFLGGSLPFEFSVLLRLLLDQFALHLLHVVQLFGQVIDRRLLLIENVLVRVSHLFVGRQMLLELSVELIVFRLQIVKVSFQGGIEIGELFTFFGQFLRLNERRRGRWRELLDLRAEGIRSASVPCCDIWHRSLFAAVRCDSECPVADVRAVELTRRSLWSSDRFGIGTGLNAVLVRKIPGVSHDLRERKGAGDWTAERSNFDFVILLVELWRIGFVSRIRPAI